jgi:hypothetical protein
MKRLMSFRSWYGGGDGVLETVMFGACLDRKINGVRSREVPMVTFFSARP